MGLISVPEYLSQIGAPNVLQLADADVREEVEALTAELREVENQLAAVKTTIYGLSVIYGPEILSQEILASVRPEPRKNKRGLTEACRTVLRNAAQPSSVSEVCAGVNHIRPELLEKHRSPMGSVMSALRAMESRGEVIRAYERGRSVWKMASQTSAQQETPHFTAQASFQ